MAKLTSKKIVKKAAPGQKKGVVTQFTQAVVRLVRR